MDFLDRYTFIKKLTKLPFVDEIWIFGSRARGENGERSDIDLALLCPMAAHEDWRCVLSIIDDADTLLNIDCVRFDTLQEGDCFRDNIISFKKVIYKRDSVEKSMLYWKDSFLALGRAVERLKEVIDYYALNPNEYIRDASIQRFEFVMELYWKVLKKILRHEKIESGTPRGVISLAFQYGFIDDEQMWLAMLEDRNNTSHVYKQEDACAVFDRIRLYLPIFIKTFDKLKQRYEV